MVCKMLGKYHEGNGCVSDGNGGKIAPIEGRKSLCRIKEGEIRQGEEGGQAYPVGNQCLEGGKVNDHQRVVAGCHTDEGEHKTGEIACQNTDDEGDELDELFDRHPGGGFHFKIAGQTEVHLVSVGENVVDSRARKRKTDEGNGGADDCGGHHLVDPLGACQLDDQRKDHVDQSSEGSTQHQTEIAQRAVTCRAGKRRQHGADEGKGRAQENGAAEFGEELVDQRAHACAEEGRGGGHPVADDHRNGDGGSHDRKELLEREDQKLREFGSVVDVVNELG